MPCKVSIHLHLREVGGGFFHACSLVSSVRESLALHSQIYMHIHGKNGCYGESKVNQKRKIILILSFNLIFHNFTMKPCLLFSFRWCIPSFQSIYTIHNSFISTAAGVVSVMAIKSLHVHHHSADYILWYVGIIGFILSYLENRVIHNPVLNILYIIFVK